MKYQGVSADEDVTQAKYPWMLAAATMAAVITSAFLIITFLSSSATPRTSTSFAWLGSTNEARTSLSAEYAPRSAEPDLRQIVVERGDTLNGLLVEAGASPDEAQAAAVALSTVYDPSNLRGGQVITVVFEPDMPPALLSIGIKPSVDREVSVKRNPDGSFHANDVAKQLRATGVRAQGTINGSLYQSAKDAGVPDAVIVELIRIYSHAVDFQREVRRGDAFDVLYTTYVDETGASIKGGAIDYAQLTLSREPKPLYRFTSNDDQATDYFTPEGASGRRLLMRTPIDGARLTSGFGKRVHPILGYTKMHKGVDFAAPSGTPIMAAGNGVIEMAGWHGGYGRYLRVRHANSYRTAYAHMSRFANGIVARARVRQGQIIGYVGTSGRSTGPHLHYEVLADARQINPMDVKLPTGTTLSARDLVAFKDHVARVTVVLESWGKTPALVAQGDVLRARLLP